MSKVWMIAKREYLYNLKRRSFLWAAFGTPLFIVGVWAIIFFFVADDEATISETNQFGYVDNAGLVTSATVPESDFTFVPYDSDEMARAALDEALIDAYYVIPEDYQATGAIQRYANAKEVADGADSAFRVLLLTNLSEGLDIGFPAERLLDPAPGYSIKLLDTGRILEQGSIVVLFLMPLFFGIMFSIAGQSTGSFLMNGLVQEKTNRIMEILITTITPLQLLLGKILGLGLLGLTQITTWILVALAAFTFGPQIETLSFLDGISIPPDLLIFGVVYFILGYFFTGSILAAIGVLAGSEQQSNQYAALVNLTGYLIPIFLLTSFIEDSNGIIPVVLSIVPVTSPLSMIVRLGMGAVPVWQLALSISLLLISTIFVAWASAKVFRWGLLMYGKSFSVRDITGVVLGNREMGVTQAQSKEVSA